MFTGESEFSSTCPRPEQVISDIKGIATLSINMASHRFSCVSAGWRPLCSEMKISVEIQERDRRRQEADPSQGSRHSWESSGAMGGSGEDRRCLPAQRGPNCTSDGSQPPEMGQTPC